MKQQRVFATILKLWLTPRARKLANFQRRKTILELKKFKGENQSTSQDDSSGAEMKTLRKLQFGLEQDVDSSEKKLEKGIFNRETLDAKVPPNTDRVSRIDESSSQLQLSSIETIPVRE